MKEIVRKNKYTTPANFFSDDIRDTIHEETTYEDGSKDELLHNGDGQGMIYHYDKHGTCIGRTSTVKHDDKK